MSAAHPGETGSARSVSLCPEHDLRAAMTDDEFWAHVYPQTTPEGWDTEPSMIDQEDMATLSHLATPCPECGQWGACAYDAEGRAMVHVTAEGDQ